MSPKHAPFKIWFHKRALDFSNTLFHILHYLEEFQKKLEVRQCKPMIFFFQKKKTKILILCSRGKCKEKEHIMLQNSIPEYKLFSLLKANYRDKNHKWNIWKIISRRALPCVSLCFGTLHLLRTMCLFYLPLLADRMLFIGLMYLQVCISICDSWPVKISAWEANFQHGYTPWVLLLRPLGFHSL